MTNRGYALDGLGPYVSVRRFAVPVLQRTKNIPGIGVPGRGIALTGNTYNEGKSLSKDGK